MNNETLKVTVWLLNYLWLKQTFRVTWWKISQEKTSWAGYREEAVLGLNVGQG